MSTKHAFHYALEFKCWLLIPSAGADETIGWVIDHNKTRDGKLWVPARSDVQVGPNKSIISLGPTWDIPMCSQLRYVQATRPFMTRTDEIAQKPYGCGPTS